MKIKIDKYTLHGLQRNHSQNNKIQGKNYTHKYNETIPTGIY